MLFEVTDYGIDHAQYFQGHGTAYTDFDNSALGVGRNYREAFNDACDMAIQSGLNESDPNVNLFQLFIDNAPETSDTVDDMLRREGYTDDDMPEECEFYYYVGLRW